MTKKDIENKANFKPPLWSKILIWAYVIISVILNPYKIFIFIFGIFVLFFSVDKMYSFARRLDKKGTLEIWLGFIFGPVAVFFYYIRYYNKLKNK